MANGRLAHVSVPAGGYATIYTNSSGSQASVTLAADGAGKGQLSFRISDDASPAFQTTTVLATETYVQNDSLVINTTSAPGDILDRFQWPRGSNSHLRSNQFAYKYNDATQYPALFGDNSTYGFSWTSWPVVPYEMNNLAGYAMLGTQNSTAVPTNGIGNAYGNNAYIIKSDNVGDGNADNFQSRADYYYRMMGFRTGTGPDGSTFTYHQTHPFNGSYIRMGLTYDPYWNECGAYISNESSTPLLPIAGMSTSGYMTCRMFRMDSSNNFYGSERTTDSSNYSATIRATTPLPTNTDARPYMRASGGIWVVDTCDMQFGSGQNGEAGFIMYAVDCNGGGSDSANLINYQSVGNDRRGGVKIMDSYTNGPANLPGGKINDISGGKVLFLEYNETEDVTYVCFRVRLTVGSSRSDQLRLWKVDRKGLIASSTSSPVSYQQLFSYTGLPGGITDVTEELTLSFTNTAISEGQVTYRVQRASKKLWVLTAFDGDSGDIDVRVSEDLKTWKTYATQYAPDDYSVATLDDANVIAKHDSGSFSFSVDNFQNISQDGILENNTEMLHYIRSGLVLSDGDKIICQNTGTQAMSVQVFGYEG